MLCVPITLCLCPWPGMSRNLLPSVTPRFSSWRDLVAWIHCLSHSLGTPREIFFMPSWSTYCLGPPGHQKSFAWRMRDISTVFHSRLSPSGLPCPLSLIHVFLALSGYRAGALSESCSKWAAQGCWGMGNDSDIGPFQSLSRTRLKISPQIWHNQKNTGIESCVEFKPSALYLPFLNHRLLPIH